MRKNIMALMLTMLLLFSLYFSSLPLASADYTVENPYMPPDLQGDFNCNGKVDYKDMSLFRTAYLSEEYHPLYDLNGD
jgi:hypothetical protein